MKKLATVAMAAVSAGAIAAAACSSQESAVATVNGQKITKGQLDQKLEAQSGKNTLRQMVDQLLVFQYAKDNHLDVTDKEIDDKLNEFKARIPAGQFEMILKNQGLTLDDAKNILREQIIVTKAADKSISITPAQIKQAYDKNPKQIRARHILVKTKSEADSIEAQLAKGAKFDELARKFSLDPGSKDKGGELGFFNPAQMVPAFSAAAQALKPGQTSAPVQTAFGWHVIQLEDIATLANQSGKIKESLTADQERTLVPQLMNSMHTGAKIDIGDPRFADLYPSPPPAPAAVTTTPTAGAVTPAPAPGQKKK